MKQDIEQLLEKYYEGETTLEEEKALRDFFQSDAVPSHLAHHAGLFRYATETRNEHPSLAFSNKLATQLNTQGQMQRLSSWSLRIAAGVALLLIGFAAGRFYKQPSPDVAMDNASALEIKKVLALSEIPNTSASERIQAVNQSYELPQADESITQLLINTMNVDDNVNVRLSACQALARFEDEPGVREALIQSLKIQTDANVQITLIELLVSIKEKRAVDAMQRLAKNQQVIDVVRQKAEEGFTKLNRQPNKSTS